MRSRFCAFAMGDVPYLLRTTTPDGPAWDPDPAWPDQLATYIARTRFRDLRVIDAPAPDGDVGFVTFAATLEQAGQQVVQRERSRFVRADGRWSYHSGGDPGPGLRNASHPGPSIS